MNEKAVVKIISEYAIENAELRLNLETLRLKLKEYEEEKYSEEESGKE